MKHLPAVCLVLLTGCATMQQQPGRVEDASVIEVCEVALMGSGPNVAVANREADRRGVNCNDYLGAITQLRAARIQAAGAILANQPRPQPYQVPTPQSRHTTTCDSYRIGNTVQTRCR